MYYVEVAPVNVCPQSAHVSELILCIDHFWKNMQVFSNTDLAIKI